MLLVILVNCYGFNLSTIGGRLAIDPQLELIALVSPQSLQLSGWWARAVQEGLVGVDTPRTQEVGVDLPTTTKENFDLRNRHLEMRDAWWGVLDPPHQDGGWGVGPPTTPPIFLIDPQYLGGPVAKGANQIIIRPLTSSLRT